MTTRPTLVCVHAHPDDEAFFTAGVMAHYAAEGHRVVLITCTNGRLGIDDQPLPGFMPGHHTALTIATRASELQASASLLGVERVVTLGYDDSGMTGWPQNNDPGAFMKSDTDTVAAIIAAILNDESASVVVTYDEFGFYGHPDHIKTNEVTRAAIKRSPSVQRLYYPVVPTSVLQAFVPAAQAQSVYLPAWVIDAGEGTADDDITTTMATEKYVALKRASMAAHATQIDNRDVVNMDDELFTLLFGREYYVRAWSRNKASGDEADLFGGLV